MIIEYINHLGSTGLNIDSSLFFENAMYPKIIKQNFYDTNFNLMDGYVVINTNPDFRNCSEILSIIDNWMDKREFHEEGKQGHGTPIFSGPDFEETL